MFMVGLISWWYGQGWVGQWGRVVRRWGRTVQFFSIGQLLGTLFSPYRQISAHGGGDSFPEAIRSFFDKLISRIIGSIVRTITILVGLAVISAQIVVETVVTMFWLLLPAVPVVCAIMFALGWVPSW